MPGKCFLHGDGDKPESRQQTFGLFATEALPGRSDRLALILAEAEETAVSSKKLALLNGRPPFRISPYLLA